MDRIDTSIADLERRLTQLRSERAPIAQQVQTAQNVISTANTRIDRLTALIRETQTAITTIRGQVSTLNEKITTLTFQINQIQVQITSGSNDQAKIVQIQSDIAQKNI